MLYDRVLTLCENPNINVMQEACYVICNAVTTGQQSEWLALLSRDRYQTLLKALIKGLKK